MAGVSLTTVSLVLNRRKNVAISEETRARVLEAARVLGYRPNSLVRGLVRGRTQTVGVIVPRLDSSFHAAVVHGIQEVLRSADYRMLLADSEHRFTDEAREVDLLLRHRVDGIISVALPDDVPDEQVVQWVSDLVESGVALVVVDDDTVAHLADCVVADDFLGAGLVVDHLVDLGHQVIAHLSAGSLMSSSRTRRAGYEAALQRHGLPVEAGLVAGTSYFMTPQEIAEACATLLARTPRPTALFAANDDLAADAILAARKMGLHVPEDLSVAGYGDTMAGRLLQVTTVQQDPAAMGRRAAERLLQRLANPDIPAERIVLPVELTIRASTISPCAPKTRPSPSRKGGYHG